jgi:hypothetical protein
MKRIYWKRTCTCTPACPEEKARRCRGSNVGNISNNYTPLKEDGFISTAKKRRFTGKNKFIYLSRFLTSFSKSKRGSGPRTHLLYGNHRGFMSFFEIQERFWSFSKLSLKYISFPLLFSNSLIVRCVFTCLNFSS